MIGCTKMLLAIIAIAVSTEVASAEIPTTQIAALWKRPHLVGYASDSGHFLLDERKLRDLFPNFSWTADHIGYLNDHLNHGDSRAAMIASIKPLVVSAYSDELDAVILIQFPDALVEQYKLSVGDQIIASWVYPTLPKPPSDIVQGPDSSGRYNDGAPIVADFFSSSIEKIKLRKLGVAKAEWQRVTALTPEAMKRANGRYRSCFPLAADFPSDYFDVPAASK